MIVNLSDNGNTDSTTHFATLYQLLQKKKFKPDDRASLMSAYNYLFKPSHEPFLTPSLVKELARSHWFDQQATEDDLAYHPAVNSKETLDIIIKDLKS